MEKNKYDKAHKRNIARYGRKIDNIYKEAIREAVAISGMVSSVKDDAIFSFDDYPATRKRVNKMLQNLRTDMLAAIVNGIQTEWTLANNKNNEVANMVFGKRVNQLTEVQKRRYYSNNETARDAFVKRKENGLSLSDRVWQYTDQFKEEIEMSLDIGIREGQSAAQMSRNVRQYLNKPNMLFRRVRDEHGELQLSQRAKAYHPGQGVYRSSYKNARRLTATETNIAYRTADHLRYQKMDFVVGIEIHLSGNHTLNGKPFHDICDELAGKYPKDFKFTGWHPQCRCFVTSILKTKEERDEDVKKILRGEPVDGESVNKVKDVPQQFKTWLKDNAERIDKARTLPYFIKDNRYRLESLLGADEKNNKIVEPTKQNNTGLSLTDIQEKYNVICKDEDWYTNGIASQFDFISFHQGLTELGEQYGIELAVSKVSISENSFMLKFKGSQGFELERTFYNTPDGINVHHDHFEIDKQIQGKGLSKKLFRLLYKQYQQMGVKRMDVFANINIGGYTWARYGFMAINKNEAKNAIQNHRKEAHDFIEDYYNKNNLPATAPFPMRLISEQPWGGNALMGGFWEGFIDLTNQSQREVFENYIGLVR